MRARSGERASRPFSVGENGQDARSPEARAGGDRPLENPKSNVLIQSNNTLRVAEGLRGITGLWDCVEGKFYPNKGGTAFNTP